MNLDTPSAQRWIAPTVVPAGMVAAIDGMSLGIWPPRTGEATSDAYSDVFPASASLSLYNLLRGWLRPAAPGLRGKNANYDA